MGAATGAEEEADADAAGNPPRKGGGAGEGMGSCCPAPPMPLLLLLLPPTIPTGGLAPLMGAATGAEAMPRLGSADVAAAIPAPSAIEGAATAGLSTSAATNISSAHSSAFTIRDGATDLHTILYITGANAAGHLRGSLCRRLRTIH